MCWNCIADADVSEEEADLEPETPSRLLATYIPPAPERVITAEEVKESFDYVANNDSFMYLHRLGDPKENPYVKCLREAEDRVRSDLRMMDFLSSPEGKSASQYLWGQYIIPAPKQHIITDFGPYEHSKRIVGINLLGDKTPPECQGAGFNLDDPLPEETPEVEIVFPDETTPVLKPKLTPSTTNLKGFVARGEPKRCYVCTVQTDLLYVKTEGEIGIPACPKCLRDHFGVTSA